MSPRRSWFVAGHFAAVALVTASLGAALVAREVFDLPDPEMLFLLAVIVTAIRFGRGPAILAAALGVACYDFFFVPPFFTFDVADRWYFLTFAMMFIVGWLLSELTTRIQRQEQKALTVALERARLAEEARASTLRAKTEETRAALLSAVSHDLRSPLASITGAATTLRDNAKLSPSTRGELVEAICDEAMRLERLVGNLLDMTRLSSGEVTLKRDWIPLDEIVTSALTRLEDRLGDRPIRMQISPDLPLLFVDPVLFEQLFVNLFENAAKYTPQGAPIDVVGLRADDSVVLDVSDRGPGLEPEDEEKVFDSFYRGRHAGSSGAGLGLSICRAIAEAHGGRIQAANREGGGLTFRITLPAAHPPPVVKSEEAPRS